MPIGGIVFSLKIRLKNNIERHFLALDNFDECPPLKAGVRPSKKCC